MSFRPRTVLAALVLSLPAGPARALEPRDVFLVVNRNVPASQEVADHYCKLRGVPKENVLHFDLPDSEDISRKDYDKRLADPLRGALRDRKERAKVVLCVYGVPLRVAGPGLTPDEKSRLAKIDTDLTGLRDELKGVEKELAGLAGDAKDRKKELEAGRESLRKRVAERERLRAWVGFAESEACVDSELMLLWWEGIELRRWQINPLYWRLPDDARAGKQPVLLTARLDGPTPEIAKGLVDQAVAVEKTGLKGKVYIDARGIAYDAKADPGLGYGGYDESMREAARLLEKGAGLGVTLDDEQALFAPGSCPDCALYCGWYSLANYVDCCKFVPGAVAWHLASYEAVTLRKKDSKMWCKSLLEKGVAATLGPVAEPYTIAFPKPAEFFGMLATGKYTLVECYARTTTLTSWMGVLIGDPLYNPFARAPLLKEEQIKPSPAGGKWEVLLGAK
jgi:uncharacterized protein (TIGR03790 family)